MVAYLPQRIRTFVLTHTYIYTKLHVFNPKEQSFAVLRSFVCLCYPRFLTLVVLFLFTLLILLTLNSLKVVISKMALKPYLLSLWKWLFKLNLAKELKAGGPISSETITATWESRREMKEGKEEKVLTKKRERTCGRGEGKGWRKEKAKQGILRKHGKCFSKSQACSYCSSFLGIKNR